MSTLKELIAQRTSLELKIAEARQSELGDAISKVKSLIEEYGLTIDDIFPSGKTKTKSKVAAKYRDPVTGKTWTGRGMTPKWIEGGDKNSFLIV
jgi:DNA-binding protein H-NS